MKATERSCNCNEQLRCQLALSAAVLNVDRLDTLVGMGNSPGVGGV